MPALEYRPVVDDETLGQRPVLLLEFLQGLKGLVRVATRRQNISATSSRALVCAVNTIAASSAAFFVPP
jgi:hypothetical protein